MISTAFSVTGTAERDDTRVLDGQPLFAHLLPEREVKAELARVDVKRDRRDTYAASNLALNLGNLFAKSGGGVVSTTRKLDVVANTQGRGSETSLHGRRRHASNHDR